MRSARIKVVGRRAESREARTRRLMGAEISQAMNDLSRLGGAWIEGAPAANATAEYTVALARLARRAMSIPLASDGRGTGEGYLGSPVRRLKTLTAVRMTRAVTARHKGTRKPSTQTVTEMATMASPVSTGSL